MVGTWPYIKGETSFWCLCRICWEEREGGKVVCKLQYPMPQSLGNQIRFRWMVILKSVINEASSLCFILVQSPLKLHSQDILQIFDFSKLLAGCSPLLSLELDILSNRDYNTINLLRLCVCLSLSLPLPLPTFTSNQPSKTYISCLVPSPYS